MRSRERWERALAVALLAALLIVPSVIALLGDEDGRVNRFTIADEPAEEVKTLDIELAEPSWDGAADADGDGVPDAADGMGAGETVAKDPTVRNVANVDAWVAVEVSVPVATVQTKAEAASGTAASARELFSYEVNGGWTEDGAGELSDDGAYMVRTYYADAALAAGESTPALFDEVTLIDFAAGQLSGDVEILVNAIGVQKEGFATAAAAIAAYRGDAGGSDGSSGATEPTGDPYALILDNSGATAALSARAGYAGASPMVFTRYEEAPQVGQTHNGVTIAKVYAVDEEKAHTLATGVPWRIDGSYSSVTSVTFEAAVKPASTAYWFDFMSNCTTMDLAKLDTSAAVCMAGMFRGCSKLTELDLSGFETAKVESFEQFMSNCSSLAEIDLSGLETDSATDMRAFFFRCSSLAEIDIAHFKADEAEVSDMFRNCLALESLKLPDGFGAGSSNMNYLFADCRALVEIDLSGASMESASAADYAFLRCNALERVVLPGSWKWIGESPYLPAPSADYVAGADGLWYSSDGTSYEPSAVPAGAGTWHAKSPAV